MIEQLKPILEQAGIPLNMEQYERLEAFHHLLMEWNSKIDLTNVPEEEMALLHYADSLLPLAYSGLFLFGKSLIDVGTGAGFPGMVVAIVRGDMRVCLLDALKKRCLFLGDVKNRLGLTNVDILHARAEDAARGPGRGAFDIATARAVAPLNVLAEYLLPFVKKGGKALCWKGPQVKNELDAAARAARILGGEMGDLMLLPMEGREHYVQVIHQKSPAPGLYPRRAGMPSKTPLGV